MKRRCAWIVTWYDGKHARIKHRKSRKRALALAKSKAPIADNNGVNVWRHWKQWMESSVHVVYDKKTNQVVVHDTWVDAIITVEDYEAVRYWRRREKPVADPPSVPVHPDPIMLR